MKNCILILALTVSAFAINRVSISNPHVVSDNIEITVVNDWTLSEKALDLAIMETPGGPVVLGIDNGDDVIRIWDNGQTSQSITLPPASTGHSWGIACKNDGDTVSEIIVNDFDKYDIYRSDDVGLTWDTFDDPGGKFSRGMDWDGTHYWTVINSYTDQLCRFQPGGTSETWDIPEIGANQQGSGLALFPLADGNTGIILAVFDTGMFFFYSWDGSTVTYIDSAQTPFASSVFLSCGVAYCDSTGNFFWVYGPESGFRMVEFSVSMTSQALAGSTWGAIKSSY